MHNDSGKGPVPVRLDMKWINGTFISYINCTCDYKMFATTAKLIFNLHWDEQKNVYLGVLSVLVGLIVLILEDLSPVIQEASSFLFFLRVPKFEPQSRLLTLDGRQSSSQPCVQC